jgi:hypothetical protein
MGSSGRLAGRRLATSAQAIAANAAPERTDSDGSRPPILKEKNVTMIGLSHCPSENAPVHRPAPRPRTSNRSWLIAHTSSVGSSRPAPTWLMPQPRRNDVVVVARDISRKPTPRMQNSASSSHATRVPVMREKMNVPSGTPRLAIEVSRPILPGSFRPSTSSPTEAWICTV